MMAAEATGRLRAGGRIFLTAALTLFSMAMAVAERRVRTRGAASSARARTRPAAHQTVHPPSTMRICPVM